MEPVYSDYKVILTYLCQEKILHHFAFAWYDTGVQRQ
jgi:hypothetical protein